MSPAAAMSRSSASQGKTVALVASVAALAGLAGGFAIRAAHGSTGSNSTQLGSTGDQGRGSAVTGSDDSDTGGVFAGRGATGRSGAGAVPSPFRGGGQSSTSSGGS